MENKIKLLVSKKKITGPEKIVLFTILVLIVLFFFTMFFAMAKYGIGPGLADYTYKIANSCELGRSSAHMVSVSCEGIEGIIEPKVTQLGWNYDYLIATTHPVTKTDPRNPNCLNCVPDESIVYWWIIDLKNKNFYGPLESELKFFEVKNRLNLPDIELISVEEAKKRGIKI